MSECLPSVILVLARRHKELVFEVLKLRRGHRADQTVFCGCPSEQSIDVVTFALVLNQDFLPLKQNLLGACAGDSLFDVLLLKVGTDCTANDLLKSVHKLGFFCLFHYV